MVRTEDVRGTPAPAALQHGLNWTVGYVEGFSATSLGFSGQECHEGTLPKETRSTNTNRFMAAWQNSQARVGIPIHVPHGGKWKKVGPSRHDMSYLCGELLQTSFADFLIRADGSVGSHRGTSNGRCCIPTLSVNLPDHLNYCTISSTAELCGIRLALQCLLNLPGEFKADILTNSHARWDLHLQWEPS